MDPNQQLVIGTIGEHLFLFQRGMNWPERSRVNPVMRAACAMQRDPTSQGESAPLAVARHEEEIVVTESGNSAPLEEDVERAALFLTTEHVALQTGRSATIFEANGRVGLYLGALSGAIVALALVAQATGIETAFYVFGLAVLLPLLGVGIVTFTRVVQTGVEDTTYVRRIERIRRFYVETSPTAARYLDSPYDRSVDEAMQSVGFQFFHWQLALTTASMVAIVNSAVAGAVLVMLISSRCDVPLPVGAVLAVIAFLVSCGMHAWYQRARWVEIAPVAD